MLTSLQLRILLSVLLLFYLWKETQGKCSSCPNGCSQTGMSQGLCFSPRYHRESYKTAVYLKVTTYHLERVEDFYNADCGFWGWDRCKKYRYRTEKRASSSTDVKYQTSYHSYLDCHSYSYCCPGYIESGSSCHIVNCSDIAGPRNGYANVEDSRYGGLVSYHCNSGYILSGSAVRQCQSNGLWSGEPPQCIDINECEETGHTCHPDRAYCLNRDGGYDCKCKAGYLLSKDEDCIDLNECETGQHNCNPRTSICINTIDGYECHCKSGYALNVTTLHESTCKDVDECLTTQAGNCEHRCGNTLGSYQCYCNEGYLLEENTCKKDVPPCAEEQLPVPGNGSVSCIQNEDDFKCEMMCQEHFMMGTSVNISPQYCHDSVWDFQRDAIEIPDCQPIKNAMMKLEGNVNTNMTCLVKQKYIEIRGADEPIPPSIEAQCEKSIGKRKRSVDDIGMLILTFTFSEEIPLDCDADCLDRISWTLLFQYYDVEWRITTGFTLTAYTLDTSVPLNITLQEDVELQLDNDNPQITCAVGTILSENQEFCIPCGAGSFFSNSGPAARCDPCPIGHYQNESEQLECKACPNGTFTIARGSKELRDCKAPCAPGTASSNGLSPCKECEEGFYQPDSGAIFCHQCDFGQSTRNNGSTRKQDCNCPAGSYWNDCLEKCPCANGGICELDGSCICPQGLTGPNCTEQDPFRSCQDSYLVSFWTNDTNHHNTRNVFTLTGTVNGSVKVSLKLTNDSTPQVLHYYLSSEDRFVLVSLPINLRSVQISSSTAVSILGDDENDERGDVFAAIPVTPLLDRKKFEEYRVVSHANKYLQTDFKSIILIISSTDNTQLSITPAHNASDATANIVLIKDNKITIVRHRLDTWTLTSSDDLTGTLIETDKPIAVYSGHECGNLPVFVSSCGHFVEQMPPVRVWGNCYVATAFMGRQDASYAKFVVAQDETYVDVYENGKLLITYGPLDQGMFRERYLAPGKALVLSSNHPILVTQFSSSAQLDKVGAPFMTVLPSLSQLVNDVPFYSKNSSEVDYNHYITITISTQYYDENAIILDDNAIHSNATFMVQSPGCGNVTVVSLEVDPGYHYLQHTTPGAGFLLTVYGFAPGTSYGYSPGLNQVLSCDSHLNGEGDNQE